LQNFTILDRTSMTGSRLRPGFGRFRQIAFRKTPP
jgi:hypothetical protein